VKASLARVAESNFAAWSVLMLPAPAMLAPVLIGQEPWRYAIRPTGLAATQLLIVALSIAPLRALFPATPFLMWAQRRRRAVGLAAFGYAALHMAVFTASIGRWDYILQGLAFASMWTGWLAFVLMAPVAIISNDPAMRLLGRHWKRLQRLVHVVALLVLSHWLLLTRSTFETLAWFTPLALLMALRLFIARQRQTRSGRTAT
jgi:methionine sulfoxide reductase heme-binding subunit